MLIIAALLLLGAGGGARAADGGAYYFIPVYNSSEGAKSLDESFTVLKNMVALAEARHVKLTLMFSPQYADYISTSPMRMIELENWRGGGHEIGAWHQGPGAKNWDGYSDLSREALSRELGAEPPEQVPGHKQFFAALERLEPGLKTGCMQDRADRDFLAAAPGYELCPGAGKAPPSRKASLSCARPSGREGVETSTHAFSRMSVGAYCAAFNSTPADFGPFYAWLDFLKDHDPQGLKSRTVAKIFEEKLLPENGKPAARKKPVPPAEALPEARSGDDMPRLKPVRSEYSQADKLFQPPRTRRTVIIRKHPFRRAPADK